MYTRIGDHNCFQMSRDLIQKAYFFLTAITHNRGTCHNLESIYDIDMREILLKFVVTPRNDILLIHTHAIVKTRSCVVLS